MIKILFIIAMSTILGAFIGMYFDVKQKVQSPPFYYFLGVIVTAIGFYLANTL